MNSVHIFYLPNIEQSKSHLTHMEGDRKWSGKCSKMFVRVCDKSFVCVDFRACTLFACFFYCFFSLGFFRFINEQKEEVDERQRERERT